MTIEQRELTLESRGEAPRADRAVKPNQRRPDPNAQETTV